MRGPRGGGGRGASSRYLSSFTLLWHFSFILTIAKGDFSSVRFQCFLHFISKLLQSPFIRNLTDREICKQPTGSVGEEKALLGITVGRYTWVRSSRWRTWQEALGAFEPPCWSCARWTSDAVACSRVRRRRRQVLVLGTFLDWLLSVGVECSFSHPRSMSDNKYTCFLTYCLAFIK